MAIAEKLVWQLGDSVDFYKIGYQLAFGGGLPLAVGLALAAGAVRGGPPGTLQAGAVSAGPSSFL